MNLHTSNSIFAVVSRDKSPLFECSVSHLTSEGRCCIDVCYESRQRTCKHCSAFLVVIPDTKMNKGKPAGMGLTCTALHETERKTSHRSTGKDSEGSVLSKPYNKSSPYLLNSNECIQRFSHVDFNLFDGLGIGKI